MNLEIMAVVLLGLAGGIACAIIGAMNGHEVLTNFGIGLANLVAGAVIGKYSSNIARAFNRTLRKVFKRGS